jgi:hypothetical protein
MIFPPGEMFRLGTDSARARVIIIELEENANTVTDVGQAMELAHD